MFNVLDLIPFVATKSLATLNYQLPAENQIIMTNVVDTYPEAESRSEAGDLAKADNFDTLDTDAGI